MQQRTIFFKNPVYIQDAASVVGPKEGEGPIASYFDKVVEDDLLGQRSYELAECKMHTAALRYLLNKTHLKAEDIDLSLAGDLTDEIYGTNFTMRELNLPFLGIYNACATFGAAVIAGAMCISGGFMRRVLCSTSSHFSSAERQYRFPLELGNQRTPLAQWTVTACGAALLNSQIGNIRVECATFGSVIDYGVKDANNMGAAMAPAAADTVKKHLRDTGRTPDDYDCIVTGDLADGGGLLFRMLLADEANIHLDTEKHLDCGSLIFNREAQNVGQGGSGAACSSVVFCGYFYKKMMANELKKVLLVPTGALISKTSSLQGQSIPAVAHAVSFVREG